MARRWGGVARRARREAVDGAGPQRPVADFGPSFFEPMRQERRDRVRAQIPRLRQGGRRHAAGRSACSRACARVILVFGRLRRGGPNASPVVGPCQGGPSARNANGFSPIAPVRVGGRGNSCRRSVGLPGGHGLISGARSKRPRPPSYRVRTYRASRAPEARGRSSNGQRPEASRRLRRGPATAVDCPGLYRVAPPGLVSGGDPRRRVARHPHDRFAETADGVGSRRRRPVRGQSCWASGPVFGPPPPHSGPGPGRIKQAECFRKDLNRCDFLFGQVTIRPRMACVIGGTGSSGG